MPNLNDPSTAVFAAYISQQIRTFAEHNSNQDMNWRMHNSPEQATTIYVLWKVIEALDLSVIDLE